MQTFLVSTDYAECARVIDPKRLGNQCYREGVTLIKGGWKNHPASRMWQGHEHELAKYCLALVEELANRGLDYPRWRHFFWTALAVFPDTGAPDWMGDERVHSSHRSNLELGS